MACLSMSFLHQGTFWSSNCSTTSWKSFNPAMAMVPIEAMMQMTKATRLRAPMIRVPVFKEMHAQQFDSFGRLTMVNKSETEGAK